jgi:hypothetical protein
VRHAFSWRSLSKLKGPACVGLEAADIEAKAPRHLLSGTPLVISLDGRRAAVFADRAPPSPIIRDFFVMNAAGRKITLLPELIYLGRRQPSIYQPGRRPPTPLQISPALPPAHPSNQVMCDAFARLNSSHSARKALELARDWVRASAATSHSSSNVI